MARRGTRRAALGNVQIKVSVMLKQFRRFQTNAFHARIVRKRPRIEHDPRRNFHAESVSGQFRHLSSGHIEEAAAILSNVRRINRIDAEVYRIAPGSSGMFSMNDAQPAVGREINIKPSLVFAKIRCPYAAVILVERSCNRPPVNQIARVINQQPRSVVKTRMREIKIVAHADRTGIRMIAAHNRIAVGGEPRLSEEQTSLRSNRKSSRENASVLYKAAARDHR